jgi:hypothetical protein
MPSGDQLEPERGSEVDDPFEHEGDAGPSPALDAMWRL